MGAYVCFDRHIHIGNETLTKSQNFIYSKHKEVEVWL